MPFFLSRLLARFAALGWATPVAVIAFVFATSWPLMALAEPDGSAMVEPGNYWWYFVVTSATVGYGDFFPETGGGHVVGAYVIAGGIAALTTVFTRLAGALERAKGRRMHGAITVDAADHVVLLGYTPGRTDRMVTDLLADGHGRLVLCAWDEVATHPMHERPVEFVRGDLTDTEVLRRAGTHRAHSVLVDARDDNEALAITVTATHVNPRAHLVVALRDLARAELLRHVSGSVQCVQWHSPRMITEELTSPGISDVYTELMTAGGPNTYSIELPAELDPVRVERCRAALTCRHGATLLAARANGTLMVNPGREAELTPGATLYYISEQRLTAEELSQALRADRSGS